MNSDERLIQVLENSACLRKTQLLAYLNKELFPEELRVVEIHLAECGLCNEALQGFASSSNARDLIERLSPPPIPVPEEKERKGNSGITSGTLKKQGNETGKTKTYPSERSSGLKEKLPIRRRNNSWVGAVGIAALLLIGFGLIWQFELRHKSPSELIATRNRPASIEDQALNNSSEHVRKGAQPVTPVSSDTQVSEQQASLLAQTDDTIVNRAPESDSQILLAAANIPKDSTRLAVQTTSQQDTEASPDPPVKKPLEETDKTVAKAESQPAKEEEKSGASTVSKAPVSSDLSEKSSVPRSDYETGVDLYKKKQYASALLYLKSATSDESNPKHWDAVYYSALCNKRLNKTGRAKRLFRSIIRAGAPQKSAAEKQLENMSGSSDEE